MKYPISLSQRVDEVKHIVSNWSVEKDLSQVLNWLMQFDNEDIDLGVRIIRNLNVIGFEDLNTALTIAYSKLERMAIDKGTKISDKNTLFAGIGDGAKSGAMIGYNFRIINELSEDNFMDEKSLNYLESGMIDNIVLIDDIVGTGNQATEEIKSLTQKVTPLGVKNIFLLTAVGMQEGIKAISQNTKAHVFSAFEYSELDTVTCLDSCFYEGIPHEDRAETKLRLEYYGRITNQSSPLGYGSIGALIAFYYNTPNISLPMIWSSKNSWIPLFKRAVKINGINSYYRQIGTSITKKKRERSTLKSKRHELTILVEGRTDEIFFDYVVSLIKDRLDYEKVSVISLGGFGSKKLIDNIYGLNENCLFIVEDEMGLQPKRTDRFMTNVQDKPHLRIKSFIYFLNLDLLAQSERWSPIFTMDKEDSESNLSRKINRLEMSIIKYLRNSESRFKELFVNYLDKEKIDDLCELLLSKINRSGDN
ncbi:hypothetical protein J8M20_15185 [Pseudoalteromonas luteoviolacea]|uniref:phosphoribosyltransferase-like protein n=1 Tax=Pseudoalteromonas luteoviolacea TaxID=43657 RepID=UPI001B399266|nr:TOPRIM nucleotidyl transferase/hydrolase domain-containing protein [Pseudoalteromonas luteoviolacea]MBQ4812702.1 hypothetical protein [Pseudoalteromonas luteoviolacea]